MAEPRLTRTRVRAGLWEGVLQDAGRGTALEVWHLDQKLPGLVLTPLPESPGSFAVQLPIPATILAEGVQTLLFRDAETGQVLTHFTIITGVAMEDDLRAEVDLLRAELDMLKRAFRRHCLETAG